MKNFEMIFKSRKAFIGYITAGQGGLDYTEQAAIALVDGGVDILEIGVPFSDPTADGPVIQQAMSDALQIGLNLQDIFKIISTIKYMRDVPIVLFSYFNPLLSIGLDKALQEAYDAGVNGILIVDIPFEESSDYFKKCLAYSLEPIGLISPSTDNQRISEIGSNCNSFLYYVCRNGTTGVKSNIPDDYIQKITNVKSHTSQPVVCGFGIGNKILAKQVLKHADGFVVGSAFVNAISQGATPKDLKNIATEIDPR